MNSKRFDKKLEADTSNIAQRRMMQRKPDGTFAVSDDELRQRRNQASYDSQTFQTLVEAGILSAQAGGLSDSEAYKLNETMCIQVIYNEQLIREKRS